MTEEIGIAIGWIVLMLFGRFCLYELAEIINPKIKDFHKDDYDIP